MLDISLDGSNNDEFDYDNEYYYDDEEMDCDDDNPPASANAWEIYDLSTLSFANIFLLRAILNGDDYEKDHSDDEHCTSDVQYLIKERSLNVNNSPFYNLVHHYSR